MFNTIKLLSGGLLCLAFVSCKKDTVSENTSTPENNVIKNNSAKVADPYYPYDNGTVYSYADSTGAGSSTSKSVIAIFGDTTIEGKSFSRTSAESISTYYNSTDGVTTLVSFNGKDKRTTTVLKSNVPVGTTWKDVFSNDGVPTTYEWKIVARGINKTVQGVAYSNVIQVHLLGSADVTGQGKVVFANADYYYAPNVGLIENTAYNPSNGKTEFHRELQKTNTP